MPHWRGVNNSHDWGWLLKFASITNGDNLGMVSWVYHISRELKPNSNGLKTNISSNSFANQMGCMLIRLCLAMTFDFGTPTTNQTFLSQTIQNRSKSIWNPNLAIMPPSWWNNHSYSFLGEQKLYNLNPTWQRNIGQIWNEGKTIKNNTLCPITVVSHSTSIWSSLTQAIDIAICGRNNQRSNE